MHGCVNACTRVAAVSLCLCLSVVATVFKCSFNHCFLVFITFFALVLRFFCVRLFVCVCLCVCVCVCVCVVFSA